MGASAAVASALRGAGARVLGVTSPRAGAGSGARDVGIPLLPGGLGMLDELPLVVMAGESKLARDVVVPFAAGGGHVGWEGGESLGLSCRGRVEAVALMSLCITR